MKKILITLLVICSYFHVFSQSKQEMINRILETNLLNLNQLSVCEEFLLEYDSLTRYEYIKGLHAAFEYDNEYSLFDYEFSEDGTAEEKQKFETEKIKLTSELHTLLNQINECKLISDSMYAITKRNIDSVYYPNKISLIESLQNLIETTLINESYYLSVFAEYLSSKSIVTSQKDKLLDAIKSKKIKNKYDLIPYCNNSVVINFADYKKEPSEFLEKLFRKVAAIHPDLTFSDFEFKIEPIAGFSTEEQNYFDLKLAFVVNGKKFRYDTYFYRNTSDSIDIVEEKLNYYDFYQIFNNVLAFKKSPYRVARVNFNNYDVESSDTIALILVKEDQYFNEEDFKGYLYFNFNYENFLPSLTDKMINDVIEHTKRAGLLSGINEAELIDLKNKAIEYGAYSSLSIIRRFPNIFHLVEFDETYNPYFSLLNTVTKLSKNNIVFTSYKDDFNEEKSSKIKVSFRLNGKKYTYKDKEKEFWYGNSSQEKFIGFVNSILIENGFNEKLYYISYEEEESYDLLYLTDSQVKYINTHRLFGYIIE